MLTVIYKMTENVDVDVAKFAGASLVDFWTSGSSQATSEQRTIGTTWRQRNEVVTVHEPVTTP